MTTTKPGDVIRPICWRVPKAKYAVVIRTYMHGDGIRAVPNTSPWYERIISALLANDLHCLGSNEAAIWADSIHLYTPEFKSVQS
jgi:hypothetical protein